MDEKWEIRKVDSFSYLVMPIFENTGLVTHGVTTKTVGNFATINQYNELHKKLLTTLEINPKKVIFAEQVHGDNVYIIKENKIEHNLIPQSDGLITNIPEICLVIRIADCVPIFILDSKKRVIGLIHAGWRGIVKCIVQKAILKMIDLYGCQIKDLLVGLGPSIGVCCYKVGDDVIGQLKKIPCYEESLIKNGYLDLQKANKVQLLELGMLEENIILNDYCTYHNNDLFFSYRRGDKSRMISILQLKKQE